jgi:acylphosphatase
MENKNKSEVYERMRVFGRVQGVLFRDSARRRAKSLGLKGYVKNLEDGSLELVAKGEKVRELFEWAKRGPIFARVDRYEFDSVNLNGELKDFAIRY